jgi:hypothetical protein
MTEGGGDWLLRPWIIRTYHHLFVNVGYAIETKHIVRRTKNGQDFEILMTLYTRRCPEGSVGSAS